MLNSNSFFRYYLFSLSNLIAAFGGGLILGKGVGVIQSTYFHGGSVLAFFIGTVLGLLFLQCIPERLSKLLTQFFSISCGITSLILFFIYQHYSFNGRLSGSIGLLFFLLLSVRFGFWFYSRVMRASNASTQQQSIAGVEFGYYLGMILGLIIWKLIGVDIALGIALIIDALFQFTAGLLDYLGNALIKEPVEEIKPEIPIISELHSIQSMAWCWRLASAIVFITIGIQVVIFNLSHYVTETFSAYILATFYLGVAVAAFVCSQYKIHISWDKNNLATIMTKNNRGTINFLFLILLSVLAVLMFIFIMDLNHDVLITNNLIPSHFFICTLVFVAAFVFEIVSIAMLDRLGQEEKKLQQTGMIMRTYGLMGLGAAISLWILGLMDNPFLSSFITLIISIAFAVIIVRKRSSSIVEVTLDVKQRVFE